MLWQILRVERTNIHPEKLRACIWPTHSRSRSRLLFFKIPFKLHQFIRGYSLGELCSLRQKLEPFQRCRSSLLRNLHWNEKTLFCKFYSKVNGLIHHNVNLIMSCFWNKKLQVQKLFLDLPKQGVRLDRIDSEEKSSSIFVNCVIWKTARRLNLF